MHLTFLHVLVFSRTVPKASRIEALSAQGVIFEVLMDLGKRRSNITENYVWGRAKIENGSKSLSILDH